MKNIIKKIDFYFRFKNPFYNFILEKRAVSELIFIPENIWSADSENGRKIVEGFLNFHNETIFFDLNVWKQNNSSKLWNEKLHSFDWVRDVRALGTNKARIFLRRNILQWIIFHNKWNSFTWDTHVLSRRICNLVENLSFFFRTADDEFQKKLAKSLNKQAIHLIGAFDDKSLNIDKIYLAKAIIISALSFENLKQKLEFGMEILAETINEEILKDGMHFSRSPSQHFLFLKSMIDIKNFLGLSNIPVPRALNEIITKMGTVLKFFKITNNELAIFNEYNFIDSLQLNEVVKRSNTKTRIPKELNFSKFKRISENRLNFLMDCGSPPKEKTHAGSLSFEFSYQGEKIVVNSGSPFIDDKKWTEAMRSTAAHSTVNIDDVNSSDIFSDKETDSRIAKVWSELLIDKDCYWINSAHSGYKDFFGIIHNRKIHIDIKNLTIRGQDYFSKPTKHHKKIPKKIFLRFHIHPDIKLNVTSSKKKVFLKLKNNIAWEFICSEPKIILKEGIYLGTKKIIQKNNHILISDKLIPEKKIKWLFRIIR